MRTRAAGALRRQDVAQSGDKLIDRVGLEDEGLYADFRGAFLVFLGMALILVVILGYGILAVPTGIVIAEIFDAAPLFS